MSSQFYCANCHSSEFYEDDQGYYVCQYCGIMSQDFYAETNDMEDGAVTSNVRRVFERTKASAGEGKSSSNKLTPDLLRFLEVYQYCLKMLCTRLLEVAKVESDRHEYLSTLKSLWMDYLKAWNISECSCSMLQAFVATDEGHCTCPTNALKHPIFPSKPLLLGFVYLTFRLHRSWITPAEMVHCCLSGLLPYSNLWEHIPDEIKRSRVDYAYRGFFTDQHLGPTRFVTCSSILFHASSIAEIVAIDMPPLNDPAVACAIIHRLGLPSCVWTRYTQLSQIYTGGQSIMHATIEMFDDIESSGRRIRNSSTTVKPIHSDNNSVQYIENILVMIVMAVKCCSDWQKWPIVRSAGDSNISDSSGDRVIVNFDPEVSDSVPRKDLKDTLDRIRACVPSYTTYRSINPSKHAYTFNEAVLRTLDSDYYSPVVPTSDATSSSVRMSDVVFEPCSVFEAVKEEESSARDQQKNKKKTDGSGSSSSSGAYRATKVEELDDMCSYLTYARYDHSTALKEGGQYDLPSTLLLERVAAWALVPVSLLHSLLLEKEEVLIRFLLDARSNQ